GSAAAPARGEASEPRALFCPPNKAPGGVRGTRGGGGGSRNAAAPLAKREPLLMMILPCGTRSAGRPRCTPPATHAGTAPLPRPPPPCPAPAVRSVAGDLKAVAVA